MSSNDVLLNVPWDGSFLDRFVEASVEMPPDGLNGNCTVHYVGDSITCDMKVTLVNGKREGKAIILLDDIPTLKCAYRNGTMTGNVRELDEWEQLVLMISGSAIPSNLINYEDSLLLYEMETESTHGVLQSSAQYCVIDLSRHSNRIVLADKELIIYANGERIDFQRTKGVVDLNANGRRWEGEMISNEPCGYGRLYDEEGRKEYEGFMLFGKRICHGIEYRIDVEGLAYEGCYYNNNRFGRGTLYDRHGTASYDGLWKNGELYSPQFDGSTIDNHTESVAIPSHSFNELQSFILPSFIRSLKRIVIGDECFRMVRLFVVNGLDELESAEIGEKSFLLSEDERVDGECQLRNCPKLKSIQIGDRSFGDYCSFELNNLPSLQSIDIGEYCFYFTPVFSLTGLID